MNITVEEVLTHATEYRGGRLCRCAKCGTVRRCTPTHDFYVVPDSAAVTRSEPNCGKPLFCAGCILDPDGSRGRALVANPITRPAS